MTTSPTGHGYRDKPRPPYPPTPSNGTKPQDRAVVAAARRGVRAFLNAWRDAEPDHQVIAPGPDGIRLSADDLQVLLGPDRWTGDGGPPDTPVKIVTRGGPGGKDQDWEVHESFGLIRANKVSSTGHNLFDSDITHQHFIIVEIDRCERARDLNRDWLHPTEEIIEVAMSEAQWGAFVSSFGNGQGVPCTLRTTETQGAIGSAPHEPRLAQSTAEVKGAVDRLLTGISEATDELVAAFEAGEGRKAMRTHVEKVQRLVDQAPGSAAYAAKSLNEHVENVVTKAKADIEAMIDDRARTLGIDPGATLHGLLPPATPELEPGDTIDAEEV